MAASDAMLFPSAVRPHPRRATRTTHAACSNWSVSDSRSFFMMPRIPQVAPLFLKAFSGVLTFREGFTGGASTRYPAMRIAASFLTSSGADGAKLSTWSSEVFRALVMMLA